LKQKATKDQQNMIETQNIREYYGTGLITDFSLSLSKQKTIFSVDIKPLILG